MYQQFDKEIKVSQEENFLDDLQLSEHEDIEVEVDDEDILFDKLDFNTRLNLSKEERRKFWMINPNDQGRYREKDQKKDKAKKLTKKKVGGLEGQAGYKFLNYEVEEEMK